MDNSTAHFTTSSSPVSASYVDAYIPPSGNATNPATDSVAPSMPAPAMTQPPQVEPSAVTATPVATTAPLSAPPEQAPTPAANTSEELEDQNIFTMLGVTDGTPEQRESFLDELQQVIWEDFLEYDVKLLTTKEEQIELDKLITQQDVSELEKQEKIVVYLEKLVPVLVVSMLDKALQLKVALAREGVKGMKEFFANKPEELAKIDSAEQMMNAGKWKSSVTLLNSLT